MIKARVVAGDQQAGAELLAMLRPFVYRRYLDFAAIDALPSTANLWAQDSAIQDGRTAMEIAEQAYNGQQPAHVFQQLQTYNEADVLVLWDVLEGLLVGMV